MQTLLKRFEYIWLLDFEFSIVPGGLPDPLCLVVHEFKSGTRLRFWRDELRTMPSPPFSIGAESLFIAYYSSAEWGCFLALGWPLPVNVLDLFCEFRVATNGLELPCGNGLLGALVYYALDSISADEKQTMRNLALKPGGHNEQEKSDLLDYCESDVLSLEKLLSRMIGNVDVFFALHRGRYMKAVGKMERNGIPIDVPMFEGLRDNWEKILEKLIQVVDANYHVYDGNSFRTDLFVQYLVSHGLNAWPKTEKGNISLEDDTFKVMAMIHPELNQLKELRSTLGQMRLRGLEVGPDGRNRCMYSAFQSKTGRNQPSTTRFAFGPSTWVRSLIRPAPGFSIAHVDWCQQEYGISASLSQDSAMLEAYLSGDPYLKFGKKVGTIPEDGTKITHAKERELFKACVLAVSYGMGAESLAARIQQPPIVASALLNQHREQYKRFWEWSDGAVDFAMAFGHIYTVFGWKIRIAGNGGNTNPRSLRNWPVQSNGSEMMRLAACLLTEAGIRVCCPIHDAFLIEAPTNEIEDAIAITQQLMAEASRVVLAGFELRSEAKIFHFPDRYTDPRGVDMWGKICGVLSEFS
jgi:DNA polymerase I